MILIVYFSFITKYNFSCDVCFSCAVIFTFLCFGINVNANAHVCAGDNTPLSNCNQLFGSNSFFLFGSLTFQRIGPKLFMPAVTNDCVPDHLTPQI